MLRCLLALVPLESLHRFYGPYARSPTYLYIIGDLAFLSLTRCGISLELLLHFLKQSVLSQSVNGLNSVPQGSC